MERRLTNILITGGAGFIGSHLIRHLLKRSGFRGRCLNVDKLTYAGNPESLADIEREFGGRRYFFARLDVCDQPRLEALLDDYGVDTIIHLAAESHVDRSIDGPAEFIRTNINGTFSLLEAARQKWRGRRDVLFHHVSTDEVFGSLGATGLFSESTAYAPRSPYSSSKAASDHLVRSYFHTYGLPVTVSNCSNNYGPNQFPEKLIPLMILNMADEKELPVYGDGKNVRDWLYVEDHAAALWEIVNRGRTGESYNIGGGNEVENIKLVTALCEIVASRKGQEPDHYKELIRFIKDRPGHDRRYAIDSGKIRRELGWKPMVSFKEGLERTVKWYEDNRDWVERVRNGEYRKWIEKNYGPSRGANE